MLVCSFPSWFVTYEPYVYDESDEPNVTMSSRTVNVSLSAYALPATVAEYVSVYTPLIPSVTDAARVALPSGNCSTVVAAADVPSTVTVRCGNVNTVPYPYSACMPESDHSAAASAVVLPLRISGTNPTASASTSTAATAVMRQCFLITIPPFGIINCADIRQPRRPDPAVGTGTSAGLRSFYPLMPPTVTLPSKRLWNSMNSTMMGIIINTAPVMRMGT